MLTKYLQCEYNVEAFETFQNSVNIFINMVHGLSTVYMALTSG